MIGYDKDYIEGLSKIDPSVYEPVLPGTESTLIIWISSLVAEGQGFMEIAKSMNRNPRLLLNVFLEMPSLPRPEDFDECFKRLT